MALNLSSPTFPWKDSFNFRAGARGTAAFSHVGVHQNKQDTKIIIVNHLFNV